jgi:hypothetical protein
MTEYPHRPDRDGRATYAKTDALLTTMTAGELASQLP